MGYDPLVANFLRSGHSSDNWLTVLKNDQRTIFTAASHAQKALEFLHGLGQKDKDVVA